LSYKEPSLCPSHLSALPSEAALAWRSAGAIPRIAGLFVSMI